jgi:aminoglycoside 3-N-acetyltransferase
MFLGKKKIINFLKKSNIKKGDTIFFHGNSMAIFQVEGSNSKSKTNFFWNCVFEFIGKNGTVIVPSFTYSVNKGKIFNIKNSKSKIGQFSEDFRKFYLPERSCDPIFSVCAHGKEKKNIKKLSYKNSFGKNSIFDYLYANNVKIICLGCELKVVTFLHYVEQVLNVPYREFKVFDVKILNEKNKMIKTKINFFCRVSDRNYTYKLDPLKKEMIKKNKLYISKFGRIKSYSFKAKDFFMTCKNILKNNNEILINEI